MLATVVILTKNQKGYMQKTLPVLLKQKVKGEYEVFVVDSGSTDGAVEYIRTFPFKLVQIRPEDFHYAKTFNDAAKLAKGKYLIRLSGDAIPVGENWISEMVKPFTDKKVGGTFGRYVITGRAGYGYPEWWPASRFPKEISKYSFKVSFLNDLLNLNSPTIFDLAGGACAIRKDIFEKRPFSENLIMGEDGEYAWFLHAAGFDIVYTPKAEVVHEHKITRARPDFILSMLTADYVWLGYLARLKYWFIRFTKGDPYKNLFKIGEN